MRRKLIFPAIAAGVLAVGLAAPAYAHVTTDPDQATQGGYGAFAFRVPNEQPTAGTVKLEVDFPADHPIDSVRTKPLDGWTAKVVKNGQTVRQVVWTAKPGVRINPDEFQEFEISAGPLPKDTDRLVLPAIQSYDNGQVVRWTDPPAPEGAEEPEHPAPTITLQPGGEDSHGGHGAQGGSSMADEGGAHGDSTARLLGGAGLVVGALGLGFGLGAMLRGRRGGAA